jgi:hypothetical protein
LQDAPSDREPSDDQGNLSALLLYLRPYLMYRGDLLTFYHSVFESAAGAAYLDRPDRRRLAHRRLGTFFLNKTRAIELGRWRSPPKRPGVEVLYHLKSAGMWDEIVSCLADEHLFARISRRALGVEYEAGFYGGPDPDPLSPDSFAELAPNVRSELMHKIATALAARARDCIAAAHRYEQPWPETADKLRKDDQEGFFAYRDTFYDFTRLAGLAAKWALAAYDHSSASRVKLRAFLDDAKGVGSFVHYIYHFGSSQTGLSGAVEDDAYPAYEAWEKLNQLRD